MADTTIASISIPVRLDFSDLKRDLASLQSFSIPKAIAPTVDFRQLHELNTLLDVKQKHIKETVEFAKRNVITPTVDTSAITQGIQQLQLFKQELTSIKSQAAANIKLIAEHQINTSRLENVLKNAEQSFAKQGDEIGKKIADQVSKVKLETRSNAFSLGGIASSVFTGITESIGSKIAAGTSDKFDKQMAAFGRNTERYVSNRVGRAAVYTARDLGYDNSRQMQRDIARIGAFVDSFVNPTKSKEGAERLEKAVSNAIANAFVKNKSKGEVFREFTRDAFEPSTGVQEAGLRLAGLGVRKVSPLVRLNKDFQLSKAVKEAEEMAAKIRVAQDELEKMQQASAVVFSVGGLFNDMGNGAKNTMKPMMEQVMPNAYIQPVRNRFMDTAAKQKGIDAFLNKVKPGLTVDLLASVAGVDPSPIQDFLKMIDTAAFSGITPDAVKAAAQIKALKNAGLNTPMYSVGFSHGGSEASDIVRMAELLGVNIKGVGLGSPITGVAQRPQRDFLSILGKSDKLYEGLFNASQGRSVAESDFMTRIMASGKLGYALSPMEGSYTPNKVGFGHTFTNYLAAPEVQNKLGQFLPGTIGNVPDYFQNSRGANGLAGAKAFSYRRVLAEGTMDEVYNFIDLAKQNKDPENVNAAIESLREASKDFKKNFGKTKGAIKEEVNAFSKSLELAISLFETMKDVNATDDEINKAIAKVENAKQKYFALVAENKKIEKEGLQPFTFDPQKKELLPLETVKPSIAQSFNASPIQNVGNVAPQAEQLIRQVQITQEQSQQIDQLRFQVGTLSKAIDKAQQLISARPQNAEDYLKGVSQDLPKALTDIDQALANLTPEQRLGSQEGNQLSNLKSQVTKLNERVAEIRANAINQVSIAGLPGSNDVTKSIKGLGNTFSDQLRGAKGLGVNNPESFKIAQELINAANQARKEIDDLMLSLGTNASADIKKAVRIARGQITTSERGAQQYLKDNKQLGVNFGDGINQGLSQSINTVQNNAKTLANAGTEAIKQAWQIKSPSRVAIYLGQMFTQGLKQGLNTQEVTNAFKQTAEAAVGGIRGVIEKGSQIYNSLPALQNAVKLFGGGFIAIQGIQFATQGLTQLAEETAKAGLELDSLGRKFKNIEGSRESGNNRLAELRKQSDDLGVSFKETASAYAQMAAVTKDTALEGFQTKEMSKALATAGSAYGLTSERQGLVNTAFTQLLGKGKVSQEELRGQLAESMPGAIQIAARAYGVSVPELNRMVSKGLDSNQFGIKFTQQLQAELAGSADDAAKSPQASFNRFENATNNLQGRLGKTLLPASAFNAEAAAQGINLLANNIEKLIQLIGVATATAASFSVQGLLAMASGSGLLAKAITFVSTQAMGLVSNLSKMIPVIQRFVLITAAFETFNIIKTALSDASGEFGEFAASAEKSLERYEKALAKARNAESDLGKNLPKNTNQIGGKSYLEDSIIGGLAPKEFWRSHEDFLLNKDKGLGRINPLAYAFGRRSEKENRESMTKIDGHVEAVNKISGAIDTQLSDRSSELNRLAEIDKQIEDIYLQRSAISALNPDPGVRDPRLAELKARQDELEKARQQPLSVTAELSKGVAEQIENLQKEKEAIERLASNRDEQGNAKTPEITGDQYRTKMEAVTKALDEAKKKQDGLNAALRDSLSKLSAFEKAWQKIADTLADATKEIELNSARASTQAYSSELAGGQNQATTEEQLKSIQRDQLVQIQIKNRQALAQMRAELESQNSQNVLSKFRLNERSGQAEIKTKLNDASGDFEKKILTKFGEYQALKDQITQGETQIAQSKVESARQLRDLSKNIFEFFKGLQRSSESLALELKSMDLETKILGVKAKIKGAISGYYTTFVDEFAEGLISVFETGQQQLQILNDAQKQVLARQQGLQDTLQQATELGNTIPGIGVGVGGAMVGGSTTRFSGIQVTSAVDASGEPGLDYVVSDGKRGAQFGSLTDGQVIKTVTNQNWESNLEKGDTRRGYGNQVIVRTIDKVTGEVVDLLYAHLDKVLVREGERIGVGSVLGTQGRTGSTTGAHVSVDFFKKDANYAGTAQLNMRDRLAKELAQGASNLNKAISATSNPTRSQGSSVSGSFSNTFGFNQGVANQALNFYLSQGITPKAAAYIVGNYMQESSLNPGADNGTHRGLGQWSYDRQRASGGLPSDLMGQLQFSMRDLANDSPNSLATFKNPNASDAQLMRAVSGWMRYGSGEEQSRFRYGQQLSGQIQGQPLAPTTGMTQGSLQQQQAISGLGQQWNSQLNSASNQAIEENNKMIASINSQAQARGLLSKIQADALEKQTVKKYQQGVQEQDKSITDQERRLEDLKATFGDSTPFKQLQQDLIGINRQHRDAVKDIVPQYEKVSEALTKNRSLYAALSKIPGAEKMAEMLKKTQPELEKHQQRLKGVMDQQEKVYGEAARDKIRKYEQAQREARIAIESQIRQSDLDLKKVSNENLKLSVRNPYAQSQFDYISGLNTLPSTIEAEKAALEQKNAELDKQKRENPELSVQIEKLRANYIALSKVNLSNLIGQLSRMKDEIRNQKEAFFFNDYQNVFSAQSKLSNAQKDSYSIYGLGTQASKFDQEQGRQQIEFDYQSELRQINQMQLSAAAAKEMQATLEKVKNVRLDNLTKQFDPMTRAISDTKNAFNGLLNDLFDGQKGFLGSIADFFKNVAKNLFSMASSEITDELFGKFLKKGNKEASAESKGVFGTLGIFKGRTTHEENFKLIVSEAGDNFLDFTIQAANEILAAGQAFAETVRADRPLQNIFQDSESYGFMEGISLKPFEKTSKILDSSKMNFTGNLVDGANMAAEILSNSGTKASDNLLGNLSGKLPGLIGDVVGMLSGDSKGGSGLFGSILGIGLSLFGGGGLGAAKSAGKGVGGLIGGLLGFADGGVIPGIRSKADDQLILAQKGEAVLTHRAVDLLGEPFIEAVNRGRLPRFADGGFVGRSNLGLASMPQQSSSGLGVMQSNGQSVGQQINISVTVNNDGSASVSGNQGDLLGAKLANAVKAILIQEKKPNGILSS